MMRCKTRLLLPAIVASTSCLWLGATPHAEAQCVLTESQQLLAPDATANAGFGTVDVHGMRAIIGAAGARKAYVYDYDRLAGLWTHSATIASPPELDASLGFGCSVGIAGPLAVVGACYSPKTGYGGAASMYHLDGTGGSWVNSTPWDWEATRYYTFDWEDGYGHSVAIDANTAIVGAPHDANESFDGYANVYSRSTDGSWSEGYALPSSFHSWHDAAQFGQSIAIHYDVAVVGAPQDICPCDGESILGAAYIYRYVQGKWLQKAWIGPSDCDGVSRFGDAVSVAGHLIAVGAPDSDTVARDAGAVYVFRCDQGEWVEIAMLSGTHAGDRFGSSVAFSGNWLVIGAPFATNAPQTGNGAAYVYRIIGDDVDLHAILQPSDFAPAFGENHFGWSVAASSSTAFIGAASYEGELPAQGAAYVYQGVLADCNGNQQSDGCDIAEGTSDDKNANGIPDECELPGYECCALLSAAPVCSGDVNGDGLVSPTDVALVKYNYGSNDMEALCRCDVNCDGSIDPIDVGLVKYYSGACKSSSVSPCWK
jgi:hypothetical protein